MAKVYSKQKRISVNIEGREIHFEDHKSEATDREIAQLMKFNRPNRPMFSGSPFPRESVSGKISISSDEPIDTGETEEKPAVPDIDVEGLLKDSLDEVGASLEDTQVGGEPVKPEKGSKGKGSKTSASKKKKK